MNPHVDTVQNMYDKVSKAELRTAEVGQARTQLSTTFETLSYVKPILNLSVA